MKLKSFFLSITELLNAALLSPEKKLAGEWRLFEYYTERDGELIHVKEGELPGIERFIKLEIGDGGRLRWTGNINVPDFDFDAEKLTWERKRNFLTVSEKYSSGKKVNFQYSTENEILKLLNKAETGQINFFGFFKRPERAKNN